jgi:ATP-dependent Lon protease
LNVSNGVDEFHHIPNAQPDADGMYTFPVIPLQFTVVYPGIVHPISVQDEETVQALRQAHADGQTVLGLTRQDPDGPIIADNLYRVGTEMAPGRIISLPQNQFSLMVEGRRRFQVVELIDGENGFVARARPISERVEQPEFVLALENTLVAMLEEAVDLDAKLPEEIIDYVLDRSDPGWMADFIATTLSLDSRTRQTLLETDEIEERLRIVGMHLSEEVNRLEFQDELVGRTHAEMSRSQREIFLREQMRIIQGELGEEDVFQQEMNDLRDEIITAGMPEAVTAKAMKEFARLQQIPPMAPEVGVIRTYLDWLITIPWVQASDEDLNVSRAEAVLDAEHYGLQKVKDRILEHIAVRKLAADKMKTPILCFVGPPGVGKTSMGRSIATALGREFVRMSLGGMRDEAEIRGHRRTYIGALPGRIIQTLRNAGTVNPVFMLDEIDKLGVDFRGDPGSALLEVLDPEQNTEYTDHYLDVPYDLSRVMFITTANDLYPIEPALLDRMEVIEFPSYTEEDKLAIAQQFLIPQQLEAHGLTERNIQFRLDALKTIIREYTYEAGVRNLDREIASICRKLARRVAEDKTHPKRIQPKQIHDYLGPPQFTALRANDEDAIGLVTGLAWTPNGGDVLTIEVSVLPGKGNLTLTGQLGDVMQESAQTAMSYMRARAADLNVPNDDFDNYDVHVHLPEGAVPKDGPSAGITLATAIISAFTERKVRADTAMTGEITLRGRVLPVGGIKEKVLAAHRNRIFNLLLPEQNRKDLDEIPAKVRKDMTIQLVADMQSVMDAVLLDPPADGRQRDLNQQMEDNGDDEDD